MGGTALKHLGFESRRNSKDEYFEIVKEIKSIWKQNFNSKCKDILHYSNKLDHGDIDFVACTLRTDDLKEKIKEAFNCQYISKNSYVYSFDYKNVQIDLAILDNQYDFHSYYLFSCFSPVGNVIGRLIKQKGLKWGIRGLCYPVKLSDSEQLGEIEISCQDDPFITFEKMLEFLGMAHKFGDCFERFEGAFLNQSDIFEWLTSSKLFNKDIFAFENLNHVNRKRDRLRKDYHQWLEYIKDKPNKFVGNPDKSVYIKEISNFFDINLTSLIEQRIAQHQMEKFYKEKFNGKHLIQWGITDGKKIGECIAEFKSYITNGVDKDFVDKKFKDYILLKDQQFIKEDFINWCKNYGNVLRV